MLAEGGDAAIAAGVEGAGPIAGYPADAPQLAAAPAEIEEGLAELLAINDVALELSQALAVAGVVRLTDLALFVSDGGIPLSWGSALLAFIRSHPGNAGLPDAPAHKVSCSIVTLVSHH